MKRLLSIFLAVLMCVLPLAVNVSAVEVPSTAKAVYTFSDEAAFPGENIQVKLSLETFTAFKAAGITGITYDTEALTFNGATIESAFGDLMFVKSFTADNMTLVTAAMSAIDSYNGTILTLNFTVNADAEVGEYEITGTPSFQDASTVVEAFLVPGTITVKGQDFTGLSFKDKTVTYNSEVQNVEVTGVPAGATVEYTVNGEKFTGAEDAGTYEVTATVTASGYNKWEETATLKITPKKLTANATIPSREYDGTTNVYDFADLITLDGVIEGDDVKVIKEETYGYLVKADVGTFDIVKNIVIGGEDASNYEKTDNVSKATITKKAITVKADDVTVKVGDKLPDEYKYTVTPELGEEYAALVGNVTTTATNTNTVKNYPITPNFASTKNPNYSITIEKGTLYVIDKTAQDVTVAPVDDVTYGDEGFKLGVTVGEVANDSEVTYASATPAVVAVDENGNVTILGAGTAKVTVSKAGDADYADFSETVTFTVAKKNVTVKAADVTVTKGDAIPSLTEYTVEGLVKGDELTVTLTTTAKNSNTVKDYPITVTVTKTNYPNYNITLVNGTLSVINKLKQDITVTSNAPSSITYGDDGFKIDVAYGETVTDAETIITSDNEDVAKVDENGNVTIVGAGEATITVSKAGNDTIADFAEEIKVEVAKKPITITAKHASKKVGADDPVLEYEVTGTLVGDDKLTGNVSREEGEEVGTYIIGTGELELTNSKNYDINFIGGTFTIFDKTPQDISVTPAYTKTYGDEGFKLDVVYGETNVSVNTTTFVSDNENVATVDAEGNVTIVGAGTAKITVAREGDEDLANFSEVVTVNVAKRKIKVIANDVEVYVDQTPVLSYTYEGELVGDDDFEGELYVDNKNVAGKRYAIWRGTLTLGDNYEIDFEAGTLHILKKLDQFAVNHKAIEAEYGKTGDAIGFAEAEKYNSEAEIAFTSSNPDVATVDENGYVTFVGAGKTTITVTIPGNYKFNDYTHSYTLTIRQKPITVTANSLTKKIGTSDPELTYTPDVELVEGDAFTGELTREAGEELGTYDILQGTLALSDNYKLTFVKGTFTIVDKNPQTVTVTGLPEEVTYGDAGFTIAAASTEIPDTTVTYESDNEDVITVDAQGNATIVGAGVATITVKLAGNEDYAEAVETKGVVVAEKEISVATLDTVNKTVTFDAVLEADIDAVSLDFNKLTFAPEEVEEGQTPENYVVTGLELVGDKSGNYVLTTESVLVPISDEIALVTVSAIAENGAVEGTGSYLAGATVTVKATANRNYKFDGWYVGEEKVSSEAEYTFTADADIELTATFKKSGGSVSISGGTPTRTVYFKVDEETTKTVTVDKGDKVTKPEDPTLEGYTFGGWYTDAECTEEYDFNKAVDMSITLYAKWTEVEKTPDEGEDKPDDGEAKDDEWENPYTDVDENDWYYETVKNASIAGIMNGMTEDTFVPDAPLTRAMLVTILYRLDGETEVDGDVVFEDVDLDAYYGDALVWASANAIVNGYSETEFAPDANITREQIAAIIFRYAVYKGVNAVELSENLGFEDADDISEYAISALNWIVGKGIIGGYGDGTIRPQANATRAEAATMIIRFMAYMEA